MASYGRHSVHKTTGYLGLFVAAAISAGVAVYPSKAEAFIAYHAAQCQPICDGLAGSGNENVVGPTVT